MSKFFSHVKWEILCGKFFTLTFHTNIWMKRFIRQAFQTVFKGINKQFKQQRQKTTTLKTYTTIKKNKKNLCSNSSLEVVPHLIINDSRIISFLEQFQYNGFKGQRLFQLILCSSATQSQLKSFFYKFLI